MGLGKVDANGTGEGCGPAKTSARDLLLGIETKVSLSCLCVHYLTHVLITLLKSVRPAFSPGQVPSCFCTILMGTLRCWCPESVVLKRSHGLPFLGTQAVVKGLLGSQHWVYGALLLHGIGCGSLT